jgi:hypothetical protein
LASETNHDALLARVYERAKVLRMRRLIMASIAGAAVVAAAATTPTVLLSRPGQQAPILAAPSPTESATVEASPTPTQTPSARPSPTPTPSWSPPPPPPACALSEVRFDVPRSAAFSVGERVRIPVAITNRSSHACRVLDHGEEYWETANGRGICGSTTDADPPPLTNPDPSNPDSYQSITDWEWPAGETSHLEYSWNQRTGCRNDGAQVEPGNNRHRLVYRGSETPTYGDNEQFTIT